MIETNEILLLTQLGDYELAWVDGEVGAEEDDMLPLLPAATPPPHKAVYVGDLWLADFKQLLATKGVQVSSDVYVPISLMTDLLPSGFLLVVRIFVRR